MAKKSILNLASLKDQVYEYIRHQMKVGELRPGSAIDMNASSQKLGISKTPLRDALIRLEMEGFVNILPRKGVVVNTLTVQDIKDYYQILGALENTAVLAAAPLLKEKEILRMKELNERMDQAIKKDDFDLYYEENLKLHDVYLKRSGNKKLRETADILKKRLYDFPRREGYIKEWEQTSIKEHEQFIKLLEREKYQEAADFIRDVHWSFQVQKKYIRQYYSENPEKES
ncbi:MAG: FCD domain-containing protein [Candidatus Aminicenantes bacterium]|nr:FCD domain-containing protein [Candidatus Aminicenantes bacterium]